MEQTDALEELTGLAAFLTENGFSLPAPKLLRAVRRLAAADGREPLALLKPLLASSRQEYQAFDGLVRLYFTKKDEIAARRKKQQKLERKQQGARERERAAQQGLTRLDAAQARELAALKQKAAPPSQAIQRVLRGQAQMVAALFGDAPALALMTGRADAVTDKALAAAQKTLVARAEQALRDSSVARFQSLSQLFDALAALARHRAKTRQETNRERQMIIEGYRRQKEDLALSLETAQKEREAIQKEIERLLAAQAKARLIEKEASQSPRETFLIGRNAVQSRADGTAEWLDKDFSALSAAEKKIIARYLRENILRFKTKLTRHIRVMGRTRLDMQATVQRACQTGGLPLRLFHARPRPGKTSLLLLLDVSGSCKAAAALFLTFLHLLRAAFPRGCRAYAFVNRLYDISALLDTAESDAAAQQVLAAIPRHGVYSNYAVPLHELWQEHQHEITRDTIVIFLGDARNNKNDPCAEIVKNISRKAKRAYWLNPEPRARWGSADSLALVYGQYAPMFETRNAAQLAAFIEDGIR